MMRYCTLTILTTVIIFPPLDAGKRIPIALLLQQNPSDIRKHADLRRLERYLSGQSLIEKKELREQQEEEINCCLGCLGLAPFALGVYCDVSNMSPSMYGISLGKVIGAIAGAAAVVKFDNGDQQPQTENAKKLALVQQELQKRKKVKTD